MRRVMISTRGREDQLGIPQWADSASFSEDIFSIAQDFLSSNWYFDLRLRFRLSTFGGPPLCE